MEKWICHVKANDMRQEFPASSELQEMGLTRPALQLLYIRINSSEPRPHRLRTCDCAKKVNVALCNSCISESTEVIYEHTELGYSGSRKI